MARTVGADEDHGVGDVLGPVEVSADSLERDEDDEGATEIAVADELGHIWEDGGLDTGGVADAIRHILVDVEDSLVPLLEHIVLSENLLLLIEDSLLLSEDLLVLGLELIVFLTELGSLAGDLVLEESFLPLETTAASNAVGDDGGEDEEYYDSDR